MTTVTPEVTSPLLPGELARRTGVSTDTLRHYERKGVLPLPARSENGYRHYPPEALERVQMVRRALALGFTLDELAPVLRARDRGGAPCHTVRALAAVKLEEVEARLCELLALRQELQALLGEWNERLAGIPSDTPAHLLDTLPVREKVTGSLR